MPAILIKVDQSSLFRAVFDEKGRVLKNLASIFEQKH